MLSLKEKLELQKAIKAGIDRLKAGIADLRERLAVQRNVKESLGKLKGEHRTQDESLFGQLCAGKFLSVGPVQFLGILKKVLAEINGNVQLVQEPVIAYITAHRGEGILESAAALHAPE